MPLETIEKEVVTVVAKRLEPAQFQKELDQRIATSINLITSQQYHTGKRNEISGFFPAASSEHSDREHNYHHAWVRDTAVVSYGLLEAEDQKATESAIEALDGLFTLFARPDYVVAFAQRPKLFAIDGKTITYLDPQSTPQIHVDINGSTDFYWHGRNQPDSFGEFLISVAKAQEKSGATGLVLSKGKRETLQNITDYLLGLQVWKFACSSMWENEPVHSPPPLSTVAIVAKGLEDIAAVLPIEYQGKIEKYVAECREFIAGKDNPYPFPQEKTEQHHPGNYDLATLVAFHLGAFDFLGQQAYSEFAAKAFTELGYGGLPGMLKRFLGDIYFARGGTNQILFAGEKHHIQSEAVWFMALPMHIGMMSKVIRDMYQGNGYIKDEELSSLFDLVQYMGDLYLWCNNTYPELFTPTFDGTPPTMNTNDLLWNHAVVIGALQSFSQVLQLATYSKAA